MLASFTRDSAQFNLRSNRELQPMKKIAQTPRLRRMVEGDRDRMTRVYPKNEKCKRGHPYRSDGTNESITVSYTHLTLPTKRIV